MKLLKSFSHALRGAYKSIKTGRNLRIQIVCGAYAFIIAPHFLRSRAEWAALVIVTAFVLAAEIFNTALEHLTDHTVQSYAPLARAAKDASAGAVLVCAVAALIAAAVLFLRKDGFCAFYDFCRDNLWYPAVLILMFIPALIFIRKK
jgi:diacylglycerol kinase